MALIDWLIELWIIKYGKKQFFWKQFDFVLYKNESDEKSEATIMLIFVCKDFWFNYKKLIDV